MTMSFLSCEEMLAAARSQNLSLAEAILRSDLAESRLTEEASRHAMLPAGKISRGWSSPSPMEQPVQ